MRATIRLGLSLVEYLDEIERLHNIEVHTSVCVNMYFFCVFVRIKEDLASCSGLARGAFLPQ
jgi:hypothetical protein